MENNIQIANRIKDRAKSCGISQAHLCKCLDKRRTFISEVAAGKDNLDLNEIDIVARELSTTPSYLLGETDDPSRGEVGENEVNEDETEMLELYRSLSTDNKELLKKLIEQMSGQ